MRLFVSAHILGVCIFNGPCREFKLKIRYVCVISYTDGVTYACMHKGVNVSDHIYMHDHICKSADSLIDMTMMIICVECSKKFPKGYHIDSII